AGFGLFQRKRNLFFGITDLFHGDVPRCEMEERSEASVYPGTVFREEINLPVRFTFMVTFQSLFG
ncbi:hypothetical protein ACXDIV_005791, partial [Klebsiella variicola]